MELEHKITYDKYTANYDGFSLVSGGLIYKFTSVFRGKSNSKKGRINTAVALAIICWVPVSILALIAGTLNDDSTTISFFEDFLFHIRYLFVVPFLILIEPMVNQSFVEYVKNSDYLIPDDQQEKFNRLVNRLDKLTNSYIPELLVLIVIYVLIFIDWNSLSIFNSGRNYLSYKGTFELNPAGWYYILVSVPVLQLLIIRWVWRWIIWAYSAIMISKFKLQIDPLHADQMAGLAYINLSPLNFSFILIGLSTILAAAIGIDIIYHNAVLKTYLFPIVIYLCLLPTILYSPLLFFMPFLIKAKSWGIRQFGNLIRKHNIDYRAKWIDGNPPKDDHLLGTMDNSSLADINGSYGPVQGLKLVPVDTKLLLLSFVLNLLPFIPLVFTYYSIFDLFKILTTSVFEG